MCSWCVFALLINKKKTSISVRLLFLYFVTEWAHLNPGCLCTKVLSRAMQTFDIMFSLSSSVDQDSDDEGVHFFHFGVV